MGLLLRELRVRDLGVIDDVTLSLGPGMTALTGETGAGKTLLVDALSILLGGRTDPSMVRAGATEAVVEGRFAEAGDLGEADARSPGDDALERPDTVLARSVARGGRSKAWIDGRMASIGALSELAGGLLELHGQHQHRSLVHPDAQRRALDQFGGIDLTALAASRSRLRQLTDESLSLGGDPRQRAREVEVLRFQIDEIAAAGIEDADEDGRLELGEERLSEAAAHRQAAGDALAALSGSDDDGAIDRLSEATGTLSGRAALAPYEARVRSAMADLADLATDLRTVVETWEDDPERLEQLRARRQLFRLLERKYGADLGEVLAFAQDARQRLAAIAAEEERASELDSEIAAVRSEVGHLEAIVASERRAAAPRLADEVESTLHTLAMPAARFSIEAGGTGPADQVAFELAANRGEPHLPLAKAASGGELARTMLALRLALTDTPGVMVFDEVDAGVGGTAAVTVGAALADLARRAQVLVVTHLPQVAAQADHQIEIRKSEESGRTRSEVVHLDTEGRVVELSRMLSGSPDSDSARRHARELLDGTASGTDRR